MSQNRENRTPDQTLHELTVEIIDLHAKLQAAEAERDALLRPGDWVAAQLKSGGGVTLSIQIIDKQNAEIDRLQAEVERLLERQTVFKNSYDTFITRIAELESGIAEHREVVQDTLHAGEDIDRQLWSLLGGEGRENERI